MRSDLSWPVNTPAVVAFTVAAALLVAAPFAQAAIAAGSTAQYGGTARFTPAGDITFLSVDGTPFGTDAAIRLGVDGHKGSYAGYNEPNPTSLTFEPNYVAGFRNIVGGMPPLSDLIVNPQVTVGGTEPGPGVGMSRFLLTSWTTQVSVFNGVTFLLGTGMGTITDDSDGSTIQGEFSLSSQNFDMTAASINSFSASLTAIPVPGAVWLLGTGLLGLAALGRRKRLNVA